MQTSKLKPVLIGGTVMGVLSALPLINAGNICCCLWVVCGGAVAAYMLQQDQPTPITPGDGALVGLLAGLFGTLVTVVLSIPFNLMMMPMQQQFLERMRRDGQMPPGFEEFATSFTFGIIGTLFFGLLMLMASVVFATLGGLLGAAIFKKPVQPGPAPTGTSL
jgi:hypothetical protein